MDLQTAIQSTDLKERNRALKSLYMDTIINAKIKEWCRQYRLNAKEPEDILQEGMILLDKKIREGNFRGDSSVKTYLLGICKRLIWDNSKRGDKLDFTEKITDDNNSMIPAYDQFDDIEQSETDQKRHQTLNQIVSQLKENCQEALKLYYYQNKSMAQVAENRGLKNANQAKKTVSRCRQRLRELIQDNPNIVTLLTQ